MLLNLSLTTRNRHHLPERASCRQSRVLPDGHVHEDDRQAEGEHADEVWDEEDACERLVLLMTDKNRQGQAD